MLLPKTGKTWLTAASLPYHWPPTTSIAQRRYVRRSNFQEVVQSACWQLKHVCGSCGFLPIRLSFEIWRVKMSTFDLIKVPPVTRQMCMELVFHSIIKITTCNMFKIILAKIWRYHNTTSVCIPVLGLYLCTNYCERILRAYSKICDVLWPFITTWVRAQ